MNTTNSFPDNKFVLFILTLKYNLINKKTLLYNSMHDIPPITYMNLL